MARRIQRGLSIVELLVGVAGSLFVAAATAQMLATQLIENRAALGELRVTQELRHAADLVVRELRRGGYWADAGAGVSLGGAEAARANPYAAIAPDAAASDAIAFRFSRDAVENHQVDAADGFGFRLRDGVVEMQFGGAGWQAVTDAGSLRVTAFELTPVVQRIDLAALCAKPCPPGAGTCPPVQQVRRIDLAMRGQHPNDARVVRSVSASVRLRNDAVTGACPA